MSDTWPWIAGRHELVRLVAVHHHERPLPPDLMVATGAVYVREIDDTPSWLDTLNDVFRALETVGREIRQAQTREAVEAARLRYETYERALQDIENGLLNVASGFLARRPDNGSWLVAYGRRQIGGPVEAIPPDAWEAGTPDWQAWRLALPDGTSYFGIRLLDLRSVDPEIRATVLSDLASPSPVERGAPSKRFSKASVREWYQARVENWPPDLTPPSREDDERDGNEAGFVRDAVRDARRNYAPSHWQQAGRRKSGGK